MILIIIALIAAIVLYAIAIVKSKTSYEGELENLLIQANACVIGLISFVVIFQLHNSYLSSSDFDLQSSIPDSLKAFVHYIGGIKTIFIVFISATIASCFITYLITFLGTDLQEERKMFAVNGFVYLVVLIVILVGFTVLTETLAKIFGIISTILGIIVSLKTLSKK